VKRHYYLISGLYDLQIDSGRGPLSPEGYLEFCADLLNAHENEILKQLFLFNDFRNLVNWHQEGDPFLVPAQFSKEDLIQFRNGKGELPSYFSDWLEKEGKYKGNPLDELLKVFYENLDTSVDFLLKKYFEFELDLRNISTALAMRKKRQSFSDHLVAVGDTAKVLASSSALDFGLSQSHPYIISLIELYGEKKLHSVEHDKESLDHIKEPNLVAIEKYLDELRWAWLNENWEMDVFGIMAVYSYAIKLSIVDRWQSLSDEKGEEFFNKLLNEIKASIVFSDELFLGRGKK
jgi:hypothetical protein